MEPQERMIGALIDVLRELRTERPERLEQFKPPQFNGDGDVDLFIQQFTEVATASRWNQMATLLRLREALQDGAREYGRPDTVEGIFAALRGRYGLTPREARSRLSGLRRDYRTPLHDHAVTVEKLIRKAFHELPEATLVAMMLDSFCSSLGNAALQRHLLAMQPGTLAEAVLCGNEYLEIKSDRTQSDSAKVRVFEDTEPEIELEESTEPNPYELLKQSVQKLSAKIERLQSGVVKPKKEDRCWGCQEIGHIRRDCKTHPWTKQRKTGNEGSPQ